MQEAREPAAGVAARTTASDESSSRDKTAALHGKQRFGMALLLLAQRVSVASRESEYNATFARRLRRQIFSRRRSVRQLRSPPVERDDPEREFEGASIERLSELRDGYEIVA